MKKRNKKTVLPQVKNTIEKKCGNCLCYDGEKEHCKVVVFINGCRFNMPVYPDDHCHLDELGIEVKEVRWWVTDEAGNPTTGHGKVKIEYPENDFFANKIDNYIKEEENYPIPVQKEENESNPND